MPNFFNPMRGASTFRVCRRRDFPFSALGIVALKPRRRLTSDAVPAGSGISAVRSSSVASKIWRSVEVIRRFLRVNLMGARASGAKSIGEPTIPIDGRGLAETREAASIMRGVIMTGATEKFVGQLLLLYIFCGHVQSVRIDVESDLR